MNRYLTRCQATFGADLSIGLQTKLPRLPLAVLAGCRQIAAISLLALALGVAHLPARSQEVNGSTTPVTEPVTESSSRPTLKLGSQGAAVAELQAILKLLGYYSAAVDGVYQESTATAVSAFQQAAGLQPDGIAGTETWERLLPIAPASQTTVQAEGETGQSQAGQGQATGQIGQTGQGQATGQTVAPTPTTSTSASQNPLSVPPSSSNFPAPTAATPAPTPSPQPSPTPTSTPAPATAASSTAGYTPIAPATNSATPTATATGTPTAANSSDYPVLRLGMEGAAVSQLQERLKAGGFFNGVVDGVFGSETELAVQEAQRRYNLEPDGIVGPATWAALQ